MRGKVRPDTRHINQIIEHWLPWQGSFEETARIENNWNTHNIAYLKEQNS